MKAVPSKQLPTAMAFFHGDGFIPCFNYAKRFAGDDGRIATLPDIIEARINSADDTSAWGQYFTAMSAEYFGYSKGGNRILIVAHGVGPMADMDGTVQAYSFHFKDNEQREKRGGRITKEQFLDLESGKYGEVSIIDFDSYYQRYEFPFNTQFRVSSAKLDPLVKARLGPKAEEYIDCHGRFATKYHDENGHSPSSNPYIITMAEESNCWYGMRKDWRNRNSPIESPFLDKWGLPIAHLLSIGQICYLHGNTEYRFPSFHSDVSCHSWHDGTRLLAIRGKGPVKEIHPGLDPVRILRANWKKLLLPVTETPNHTGFYTLMKIGNQSFTMYPKVGERMDTHEPEFVVTKCEPISGGPKEFRTKGYGSPFFKYGVKEVKQIAPQGANAYSLGQPVPYGDDHLCPIKFHKVEVDTSQRVMRADKLLANYKLLMSFI